MKITFLGATQTVTGSKYLLEEGDERLLVDCGLFQGQKPLRLLNWKQLPLDIESIQAVLLTHAHIDHSGYLPVLFRQGWRGKVFATPGTKDLCGILLPDSGHIHEEDARRANKYGYTKHHPALPLYTRQEGEKVLRLFRDVPYGQPVQVSNSISASWHHASHIIGASYLICRQGNTSILFSGDMGRPNDLLMNPPAQIQQADYLVVESTYGDRLHSQEDPVKTLGKIINETIKDGGDVLLPSFAVGRAQLILYMIYQLLEQKAIPDVAVYLDSPMAINATGLMKKYHKEHRLSAEICAKVCNIAQYTHTPEESKAIYQNPMPKIIISASGMATGGRVLHHLKALAPSHRNRIILAGFQASGTRGAHMLSGAKQVKIHGQMVDIRAKIHDLPNLSAHADYEELIDWLAKMPKPPTKVFITHGELEAAQGLKEKIEAQLGWSCVIPEYKQSESL